MENSFKQPYEISLWDDRLVWVGASGEEYTDITNMTEEVAHQYYKEIKLCVIGSDSMDSLARCVNPKLVRKINGENTLTFTMYYQYIDPVTGQKEYNPFNKYMVNERKIKLRLGPATEDPDDPEVEWFDFLIKNVQENSETKVFTYTCKDQFVNELSKSGFELVFDNELENNMGTVEELGEHILEGSDWRLGDQSSVLEQYVEEPLYRLVVGSDLTAADMKVSEKEFTLSKNAVIYAFYSQITNQNADLQFLYTEEKDADGDPLFKTDDDLVILREESPNYITKGVKYREDGWPSFVATAKVDGQDVALAEISLKYRGERLVRQLQTKYDSTIDKFVGVYYDSDETVSEGEDPTVYYGFTETKYETSSAVTNYVANPNNFTSTSGWQTDSNHLDYQLRTYPPTIGDATTIYKSLLYFKNPDETYIMNAGIGGNRSVIESFVAGEEYVLRIRYKIQNINDEIFKTAPTAIIARYDYDANGEYSFKEKLFDFASWKRDIPTNEQTKDENGDLVYKEESADNINQDYVYMKASCALSMSKTELLSLETRLGLFLQFDGAEIYIEDLQVFPYTTYQEDGVDRMCVPGGKLHSQATTRYVYYIPDPDWEDISDLEIKDESQNRPIPKYVQQYNDGTGFTKVRSISAKESNRFNLIQDLCEKFECWAKFKIERDSKTGKILLGKDKKWYNDANEEISCPEEERFRQQKFVTFHEYVGVPNHAGFKYGINSKSIQRTINSEAIVSKMIVKDNVNEFAPDGFCSIARAEDNPAGENFLISFDHYVRLGLLNFNTVTNDLYLDSNGYLGYYKKLKRINRERESKIDKQAGLLTDIAKYNSDYTTYKTSYDGAIENRLFVEGNILQYTNTSLEYKYLGSIEAFESGKEYYTHTINKGYILTSESEPSEGTVYYEKVNTPQDFAEHLADLQKTWSQDDKFNSYCAQWCRAISVEKQHGPLADLASANLKLAEDEKKEIEEYLDNIAEQKRALNLQFYKKYSRFIQEGTWTKEDYTDHNLYYLDSESTLHTSAQPKVTYNISVIDVSPLKGYEAYKFNIGDKTYIEDAEFFGWSLADSSSPYREEVVVSEITSELDFPEKNQIKVQNYKTQFEDLFQRITAQTQQAEYHTGEYARAASVVTSAGTIKLDTLQNSFANNSLRLANAKDQSVVWDETGITTTSLSNPSEMVRIVSGGIFLSADGGQSWKTGMTGHGINTQFLTSGQINTNEIYIMNGNNAAFRWDNIGLSAYDFMGGAYNPYKYVRFDQYGIYGVQASDDWIPDGIDEVHEKAKFALTWNGFSLKNKYGEGYVTIDSENDFLVVAPYTDESGEAKDVSRIQIGNINPNPGTKYVEPIYGIRISNAQGAPVMETDDTGELWLKNRLRIGTNNTSTVEIGYLNAVREDTEVHEVIHAGNGDQEFIVYEDGKMIAQGAEFHGSIYATGGKIGNMTIADVEGAVTNMDSIAEATRKLDISSKLGYNFKVEGGVSSPVVLELVAIPTAFTVNASGIGWFGSNNFEDWVELDSNTDTYTLTYENFKEKQLNSTYYIKAVATSTDGSSYEDWTTIMSISDGVKGEDALSLVITSSGGNYFRNNTGQTTLMARLFQGGQEIDQYEPYIYTYTWVDANDDSWTPRLGKTLVVTADDVTFSRTYVCNISKGGN